MATFVFPNTVPYYVQERHAKMAQDVFDKFPCPEGYEELEFGYNGPAVCRYEINDEEVRVVTDYTNSNYDIGIVTIVEKNREFSTKGYWYVKKISKANKTFEHYKQGYEEGSIP